VPAYTPTREGYTFGGWYKEAGCTNVVIEAGKIYTPTAGITVYAKWIANSYTVTYNGNGATGGSTANSSHTFGVAKALTANGYERKYTVTYNHNYTGSTNTTATATYTFNGWAESASGSKKYDNNASVTNLTKEAGGTVTLYANWTSASVPAYTPTREGYTFGGWYKEAGCTNVVIEAGKTYTPTAGITVYAKWIANTYNLVKTSGINLLTNGTFEGSTTKTNIGWDNSLNGTYNATGWGSGYNGGVTRPDIGYHAHIERIDENNVFTFRTNENYTSYYATDANGNKKYVTLNRWLGISQGFTTSNLTAGKTYVITMDVYIKSGTPWIESGIYHYKKDSSGNILNRDFYSKRGTFKPTKDKEWQTISWVFTLDKDYTVGTSNNAIYIYGHYSGKAGEIYVDNVRLEEATTSAKQYDTTYTSTELASISNTGYTFNGWYNNAKYTTALSTSKKFTIDNATFENVGTAGTNAYIYAKTTANTYTVTYNGNGATGGNTANSSHTYGVAKALTANGYERKYKVTYNHNYTGSTNTEATATYTFNGWAESATGSKKYNNNASVTNLTATNGGTVTLYANWTSASVPAYTPTREGYTFGGWYKETGCTNVAIEAGKTYTPTAGITVYAKWIANSYTITYDFTSVLPEGYKMLSYIEGTGTQYIDTGLTMEKTDTYTYIVDANFTNSNYGGANGYMQFLGSLALNSRKEIRIEYDGSTVTETIYVDNVLNSEKNWNSYNGTNVKIGILRLGNTGNTWFTGAPQAGKIYGATIYKGNTLVRDYVPCINSSGTVGLYDLVNSKFYTNAGTGVFTASETYKTTYTAESDNITLPQPTRRGFTFIGWTGSNGTTAQTTVTIAKGSTGNKTYKATWTPVSYTVKYDGNGATGGSTANSSHTYGTAKALTTNGYERKYKVTYNHNYTGSTNTEATATYTFNGWAESATGSKKYNNNASVTNLTAIKDGTVTLYAKWTEASVPAYTPTREGYTFGGWYKEAACTNIAIEAGKTYTPTVGITLYAKWIANTYTVTYNGNGATGGSTGNSSHTYGTAKVLTTNGYERKYKVTYNHNYTGSTNTEATATYTFNGWATSASGSKVYSNGQSVTNLTTTNGGTVTLYANWTSASVPAYTPTREGYTFGGWYKEVGCTNQVIEAGKTYTPTAGITVYAKWIANTYTIKYNMYNLIYGFGDVAETNTERMSYSITNDVVTVKASVDDGHGFIPYRVYLEADQKYLFSCESSGGWHTGSDSVQAYLMLNGSTSVAYEHMEGNNDWEFSVPVSGEYHIRLDVNLSGKQHTFSNIRISKPIKTSTVTYDSTYGTMPTLEMDGYTFVGWFDRTYVNNPLNDYADRYSDLKTAFGYDEDKLWNHYVTYTVNGTENRKISKYLSTEQVKITEDTTLYGYMKANKYTITYNANGGSGAPSSQTKEYNRNITLSTTVPTRTGYKFLGWSKSSTATTATYTSGATYTERSASNVTLYAVWEADIPPALDIQTGNVTFTCNPTTVTQGPVSVTIATNVTGYTLQYCTGDPTVESNWKTYSQPLSIAQNQAVYARLYNGKNAGSPATLNITNIDKEAPTAIITTAGKSENYEYYCERIEITITAEDLGIAGIEKITYTITGAETHSGTFETTGTIKVTTAGEYTITAYAEDKAGNVSEPTTVTGKVCRSHNYVHTENEKEKFCKYCTRCCSIMHHEMKYWNVYSNGSSSHSRVYRCSIDGCSYFETTGLSHSVTTQTNTVNNTTTVKYYCSSCAMYITNLSGWWTDQ